MEKLTIKTEYIKLSQLLKWMGIAETGSIANEIIREGLVQVNGVEERRRGKKIYHGDRILLNNQHEFLIIKEG